MSPVGQKLKLSRMRVAERREEARRRADGQRRARLNLLPEIAAARQT